MMGRMAIGLTLLLGMCFGATEPDMCELWYDMLQHPAQYDLDTRSERYNNIQWLYFHNCRDAEGKARDRNDGDNEPPTPDQWPFQDVVLP